jgi:hypothetical protein
MSNETSPMNVLLKHLQSKGLINFVVLEPQELLNDAIVDFNSNENRLVYSYDKLIDCFAKQFKSKNPQLTDEQAEDQASDWVHANTLREILHMGKYRPIMMLELSNGTIKEMEM